MANKVLIGSIILVLILAGGGWYYYDMQQKEKIEREKQELIEKENEQKEEQARLKKVEEERIAKKKQEQEILQNLINFKTTHDIVAYSLDNLLAVELDNKLIQNIINHENNKNNFETIYSKNDITVYIQRSLKSKVSKDKIQVIKNMLNRKYNKGKFVICDNERGDIFIYILDNRASIKSDEEVKLINNFLANNDELKEEENYYQKKSNFIKFYTDEMNQVEIFINESLLKDKVKQDELNYAVEYYKNLKNKVAYIDYDKDGNITIMIENYSESVQSDTNEQSEQRNALTKLRKSNLVYYFPFDGIKFLDTSKIDSFLKDLETGINYYDVTKLFIIGHTDSIGSKEYNQKLSYKRAKSLEKYLNNFNIELIFIAEGENKPVASNKTKEGRAFNRRVEVVFGY